MTGSDARPAASGVRLVVTLITVTVVMTVTSMTMIGPLLVDLAAEFGVSVGEAGQLGTATSLPWALTALVAGPTTDRFGRRIVLAISLVGLGSAAILCALAPTLGALFGLRVLMGVVGGAAPTAMLTIVGDRVPPEQRGSAMGWIFSGFGIAAVAGVPIAGAVGGAFGWRWSFAAVGAAILVLAVFVWQVLPPDAPRRGASGVRGAYIAVLRAPGMLRLLTANLGERISYATNALYLAPFLMQSYGLSAVEVAPGLALAALGAIAGNVAGGRLADRVDRLTAYAGALVISAAFCLLLFNVPVHLAISAGLGALFGFTNGTSRPSFMALASQVSAEHRGTAMGLISCSSQSGWAFGAALGGLALGLGSYPGVGLLAATVSLSAAAAVVPLRQRAPSARPDTGRARPGAPPGS